MLRLAGINAAGALVFGLVYAAAAVRALNQAAFLVSLVVLFGAVTACWVHVERSRGRARDPLSRLGRLVGALGLTVLAVPGLLLMPLFALKQSLPAEAGIDEVIRPVMVLLLVSLALVVSMNLAGLCFMLGAGVVDRLRRRGAG